MFNWQVKQEMTAKNAIFLAEIGDNNGRPFKSRFLQAGLVKYDFGVCLLKKETIDKFVNTFINQPVIIGHKDTIIERDVVGYVHNIWFSPEDGWFWCDGTLKDEEAIKLVEEKGFNVSCQYRITEYTNNEDDKLHNGNPYDKEIINGIFEHLALVECPRYEDAFIAVNAYIAENEFKEEKHPRDEEGKFTEKANKLTTIKINKNDIPKFDSKKELSNWVKSEFEKLGTVKIEDTEVDLVLSSSSADRETFKRRAMKEENKAVYSQFEKIVKSSIKKTDRNKDESHIKDQEIYYNKFQIIDGENIEDYEVEIFVDKPYKEDTNSYYAGHKASKIIITPRDTQVVQNNLSLLTKGANTIITSLEIDFNPKASNSFVEVFRNMLYDTLAEGIYERLTAVNKKEEKKEDKKESEKEVISESKEYTLQKNRIRTLMKQGFDKKKYYEKLDAETSKLWKAYTKAMRETTIYWDDSEDDKKIKKEKLESIHEEYAKKRDERNKAVQELNAITRETKAQQIEIINNIKENIDIEKSLKSYNSSEIDKKIKKVIDEYDINKINLEQKEINKKLEGEKNKWLKYINSASSVEEQNKRLFEYDKWYKDSDIKKKDDELSDKIVNFSEYRNKAISEALQIENGGDFRLTTVKGSKLTQKINKTNQLLSGIIDKNYIPDFSPFANGQAGRANASGNIINITSKEPVEIYIHESMHWLERVNPKMLANSLAFLEYRTKGEEAQSLKKLTKVNYRANEYAKPDNFFDAYCGKIYDNATEIMSMGIQRLFEDPKDFMEKDKEYFDFVIANLQGKI